MSDQIHIIGFGASGKVLTVALDLDHKNVIAVCGSLDDRSRRLEKTQVLLNDQTELEAEIEVDQRPASPVSRPSAGTELFFP